MALTRFAVHVDADGRLLPLYPERTKRYAGREVWISLHEKPAFTRGSGANRYLWLIYGVIAAETGNDPDTIHQALKREAVRVGVLEPQYVLLGSQLLEGEPTTVVEQEQFSKYVDWIKAGCLHGDLVGMRIELPETE
jgi:hypothetical protein